MANQRLVQPETHARRQTLPGVPVSRCLMAQRPTIEPNTTAEKNVSVMMPNDMLDMIG